MSEVMFSSTEVMKSYHGFDGKDGKQSISLNDGEALAVSDDKAKQLVADFPENFSEVADGTAVKQVGKKKASAEEKDDDVQDANKALEAAEKAVVNGEAKLKKARQIVEDMPAPGTAGSPKAKNALKAKADKADKAEAAAEKALAKAEEELDDLKGEQE